MKLLSLKLLNYRKFRQEEIFFQDDFTLIFWKNGSWKSSIFDAIWFALFWPKWTDFIRLSKDLEKSFFIKQRESSKIELVFQYWMDEYKVVRIIDTWTKKFASNFIIESKDILTWPNKLEIIWWDEINNYIEKLLWIWKETFLRSVFTAQKDLEVLSGWLKERKELINKVLWLDKIENIIENLKKEEKDKKTILEVYKSKLSDFDKDTFNQELDKINIYIIDNNKLLTKEEEILIQITKDFELLKQNYQKETQKRDDFFKKQSEITQIQEKIKSIENEQKKLNIDLLDLEKKQDFLQKQDFLIQKEKDLLINIQKQNKQKQLFQELEKCLKEQKLFIEKLDFLENNFKKLWLLDFEKLNLSQKLILEEKELKNKILFQEITIKNQELSNLENEWKILSKEKNEIEKLSSSADCPTCKRPLWDYSIKLLELYEKNLKEKKHLWVEKKSQVVELIKQKEFIENEIKVEKTNLEQLQLNEKKFIEISQDIKNTKENIQKNDLNIKDIWEVDFKQEIFETLENEYQETKKELENYLRIKWEVQRIEKIKQNILENNKNLESFNQNLKNEINILDKVNFSTENYEKLKQKYFSWFDEFKEKNKIIQVIKEQKQNLDFELQKLILKEKSFKQDHLLTQKLIKEISFFSIKIDIFKNYILYLLDYLKPHIEDLASHYFALITDNKYSSISLDENYNITIDGKNIEIYSWWEKDLANLCFRLSLGQNLTSSKWNPINFLVLDEILASQDKERQQNIIFNLLKLKSKFSQILLVSHIEESKEFVESLIEVKSINNEESKIIVY